MCDYSIASTFKLFILTPKMSFMGKLKRNPYQVSGHTPLILVLGRQNKAYTASSTPGQQGLHSKRLSGKNAKEKKEKKKP